MIDTTPAIARHFAASAAMLLAIALRWALDPWLGDIAPLATLYAAVVFTAWHGGRGSAVTVAALGYLACNYLFVSPRFQVSLSTVADGISLAIFLATTVLIVLLGERIRRSDRRASELSRLAQERQRELEREAVERRLAEHRLVTSLDRVSDAFARFDRDWRFLHVNAAQERAWGKRRGELLGRAAWDVFAELRGTPFERELRRAMTERTEAEFEHQLAAMDRWECVRAFPTDDGGLALFCVDITARKRSEELLCQGREREQARAEELQTLFANAPTPTWISFDPRCASITGNPAADALLRVSTGVNVSLSAPPDESSVPYRVFRDGVEVPIEMLPMQRAARQRTVVRDEECELVFPDGRRLHLLMYAAPLWSGTVVRGAIASAIDITDRKQREAKLEELNRTRSEFLATLAHELQSPLAPIRQSVTLMQMKCPTQPELAAARDVIDRQVQHMARLLDDLMDVNRIGRQKLELRRERVDLRQLLGNVIETTRPSIAERRHHLAIEMPTEPIVLDADPLRLAQVFGNLLCNAAKYTRSGGEIALRVVRDGGQVLVSVEDDGIGIEPRSLPRIFEMFSRGGAAPGRAQSGLGIGLALAKGLVELHGGWIAASSAGRNLGSVFTVCLPIDAGAAPPLPSREFRAESERGPMAGPEDGWTPAHRRQDGGDAPSDE